MKFKKPVLFLLSLAMVTAVTVPSRAQAEQVGIGLLGGATFGSGVTAFTFGAEGTYELSSPFGLGASMTYYTKGYDAVGTTAAYSTGFFTLAGQGLYFFTDMLQGLRAGLSAGLAFASTTQVNGLGSTSFIFGPTVGYDYTIWKQVTVGGEGNLYFNTASGSSAFFQLLGAVKYWF